MKPIILRAHEVRQLHAAGEVLVVRRIEWPVYGAWAGGKRRVITEREAEKITAEIAGGLLHRPVCPHGMPRERRWVRETWHPRISHGCSMDACDCDDVHVTYAADGDRSEGRYFRGSDIPDSWLMPKASERGDMSPATMPRWASRYVVEIAEVRARQVQAITEAEAIAAGFELVCMRPTGDDSGSAIHGPHGMRAQIRAKLWDANPWVWLARARRVEA